jgi:hypothetical protein
MIDGEARLDIMEPADAVRAPEFQEGQGNQPSQSTRGKEVTPKKAAGEGLEEQDVTKARSPTKSAKAIQEGWQSSALAQNLL